MQGHSGTSSSPNPGPNPNPNPNPNPGQVLAQGHADMVSMARPFLADPFLVLKAKEGREGEINTCIACNQACNSHRALHRTLHGAPYRATCAFRSTSNPGPHPYPYPYPYP